jgi:Protein of unknown function (DUF4240)
MSRFDKIEKDFGQIFVEMKDEFLRRGEIVTSFNVRLRREVYHHLIDKYLSEQRYDELIDYFTYNCGPLAICDQFFVPISDWLIKVGDRRRFLRLWRTVIANRGSDFRKETLAAMMHLIDGLEQLNDKTLADEVRAEMELFKEGKRRKLPKPDPRPMTESLFWELIDEAKSKSKFAAERPSTLGAILECFSAKAIKEWALLFRQKMNQAYRWDIWGVAYIIGGGCSDDGFEYFRALLISEGERIYTAIVNNPDSITELIEHPIELESMLYVAADAYQKRANKPLTLKAITAPAEPVGKKWADADLPTLFPKTYEKYSIHA